MIEPIITVHEGMFARWQKIAVFAAILVLIGVNLVILNLGGRTNDTLKAQRVESQRLDCVTTLSAARRNVFDEVDLYKAHSIQMLSDALLGAQQGIKVTPEELAAYKENNVKLTAAVALALNLPTLDHLIAHGGTIEGKVYPAC